MTDGTWRKWILLPWISLPLLVIAYLTWWNSLPPQLAVHFGPDWTPNTHMSREVSLGFDVFTLLVLLSAGSRRLWRERRYPSVGLLVFFYVVIAVVNIIFWLLLRYNLQS
jgi:hypothetical protein